MKKWSFCLTMFVLLLLASACTSSPMVTETAIPTVQLYSGTPSYQGIAFASEIDSLSDGETDWVQFVDNMASVHELPDVQMHYRSDDIAIFQCNLTRHTGTGIGSITEYRVCSINQDGSQQNIIAEGIYAVSLSPDAGWLALMGDTDDWLTDCTHQLYMMRPDDTELHPLISEAEYENYRLCSINDVTWQPTNDGYELTFTAWTGSEGDYPAYRLIFGETSMTGTLIAEDDL